MSGPFGVGQTVYFGSNTWPADSDGEPKMEKELAVEIRAVHPVVRENTAAARITVLACVRKAYGDESMGSGRAGDVNGPVRP